MSHNITIPEQTCTFKHFGIHLINYVIPITSCPSHSLTISVRYFSAEQNVTKNNNTLETSRVPIIDNVIIFYYLTYHVYSLDLKGKNLLQPKNVGVPFNPHSYNIYQQTRSEFVIYHCLLSHQTHIQSQTQQNKANDDYQDPFKLSLSSMKLLIHQQHHNQISKLSLKWILTMYLTLFVLLCFPLVLHLEDLTQCSRPCDLILSRRRRIPPTIPP